jgi:hypothetical protein
MSFAPLALDAHSDYDIQYDWDSDGDGIADNSDDNIDGDWYTNEEEIAAGTDPLDASSHPPELKSSLQQVRLEGSGQYVISTGANAYALTLAVEGDEQDWTSDWMDVMAVHQHEDYTDKTVYAFDDPENEYLISSTNDIDRMAAFFATFDQESRFSYNVQGGPLDGSSGLGEKHPTSLGDGPLDAIPSAVRDLVWQPMGINVMFQFLLLGCMAGALLGGSQGLARSLFGQMVPETRSAEFFGFFGFFGKVAALLGPMIYGILTVAYDSRVGVASLCILIIIGTVLMRFVDVEAGRADAQAEDARNRGIEI